MSEASLFPVILVGVDDKRPVQQLVGRDQLWVARIFAEFDCECSVVFIHAHAGLDAVGDCWVPMR